MNEVDVATRCSVCACPVAAGQVCSACLLEVGLFDETGGGGGQQEDYEVLDRLGRGGMGIVNKVRNLRLNRLEAMKRMAPQLLGDQEMVLRFLREAEAVARLDHPHIVPILSTGEDEDGPFFTMRLMEEGSLAERLKSGPMDPRAAVEMMLGVAQAVEHAHQRGVLHRDLKPGNILLFGKGAAAVSDFGLARITEGRAEITVEAMNLGSPAYMAPEQLRGVVSITSDVYSLGAVLFEMLTGRPPFRGGTTAMLLTSVENEEAPRLRSLLPKADLDLETLCAHCLEKDPSRRYASAGLLAADLQAWLAGKPIVARPVRTVERIRKWMVRRPLLAGLVAAVVILLAAGIIGAVVAVSRILEARQGEQLALKESESARSALTRELYVSNIRLAHTALMAGDPEDAVKRLRACRPKPGGPDLRGWEWSWLRSLRHGDADVPLPSGSPHGKFYALGSARDGSYALATETELLLYGADDLQRAKWTIPQDNTLHRTIAFSHDGQRIAVSADDGIKVYNRQGEVMVDIRSGAQLCMAFSPDGSQLAASNGQQTAVLELPAGVANIVCPYGCAALGWSEHGPIGLIASSTESKLMRLGEPNAFYTGTPTNRSLGAMSPDGKHFVVVLADRLEAVDTQTGEIKHRIDHALPSYHATFSLDGQRLLVGGANALHTVFDTERWRAVGKINTTMSGVSLCQPRLDQRWSMIFVEWSFHCLQNPPSALDLLPQRLVPNASLAHGAVCHSNFTWSYWEATPATKNPPPRQPGYPIGWLPDGNTLLFINKDAHVSAWTLGDENARPYCTLAEPALGRKTLPCLSPDGQWIASPLADDHIGVFRLADGQLVARSELVCYFSLQFSPDSTKLAYLTPINPAVTFGENFLRILDLPSGKEMMVQEQCSLSLAWSPDGQQIAYGRSPKIMLCDATTGQVRELGNLRSPVQACQFTPDGRTVVATGMDTECAFFSVTENAILMRHTLSAPASLIRFSSDGQRCLLATPLPVTFLDIDPAN